MVHPGRAILNRDPMIDGLPLPNRSHPSRAAGSFIGPLQLVWLNCRSN